jgi:hypothetical protein
MQSPFGQYAPLVASVVGVGIIAAYIIAQFFPGMDVNSIANLGNLAWLAAGAIFGSALAVNGWKGPLSAAHTRLDKLQTAVTATAAASESASVIESVSTILNDGIPPSVVEEIAPGS